MPVHIGRGMQTMPVYDGSVGDVIGKSDADFLPAVCPDDWPQIAPFKIYQASPVTFNHLSLIVPHAGWATRKYRYFVWYRFQGDIQIREEFTHRLLCRPGTLTISKRRRTPGQ